MDGAGWKILAVALLFAVAMTACGKQELVRLDAQDDESQVEMQQGEVLMVTLEGNPSTGYTWERADDGDQVLEQEGEPAFTPESDKVGAGGVQVFRFHAATTGRTTLRMVYHRPWEEEVEPLETWSVEVVVR